MLLRIVSLLFLIPNQLIGQHKISLVFINKNDANIWIVTKESTPLVVEAGGFKLVSGKKLVINMDARWRGSFSTVTICHPTVNSLCDENTCSSRRECIKKSHELPRNCVQFAGGFRPDQIFYILNLGDGFNMKSKVQPFGGEVEDCAILDCQFDFTNCLKPLRINGSNGSTIACHSSCSKFHTNEYCCTEKFNSPTDCLPYKWKVNSASMFNKNCADEYAYAYDDSLKFNECFNATGYTITFG